MIATDKLAAALRELSPHSRELLEMSLRRRVPDEALATLFEVEPGEVARRRAEAIEQLSQLLEVQRGEDLGHVLKALLQPETWEEAGQSNGREPPLDSEEPPAPVLELLADRGERSPPADTNSVGRRGERHGRPRWLAPLAAAAGLLALLAVAGVAVLALTRDDDDGSEFSRESGTRPFVPTGAGPRAAPFPSDPVAAKGHPTAFVRRETVLLDRPAGRPLRRIAGRTEWGSPRVLGVVQRRAGWLAVQAPELRNGQVGWLPAEGVAVDTTPWSLHADLSRRVLEVRRDGRTVRRFSVTDKLRVTDKSSPYGCCVLALSGHQLDLPPDWPGGDRLAVHATRDLGTIGQPVSLGCMRARPAEARWLIETIPLGSPIFVAT